MTDPIPVAICIATHRRPAGLVALLDSIDRLDNTLFDGTTLDITVAVVDNDPDRSARLILSHDRRYPVLHIEDSRRGYATVRNATVALVDDRTDWYAFVDDDEVVHPSWLTSLLEVALYNGAAVVAGSVVSIDQHGSEIRRSALHDLTPGRSGTHADRAHTDNLLVSAHAFRAAAGFDTAFDQTGGEDIDLTHRIRLSGGSIVFAPDALVDAIDHPERHTIRYAFRRAYAGNHNYARVRRTGRNRPETTRMVVGLARITQGALIAIAGTATRRHDLTSSGAATLGGGLGTLLGTFDVRRIPWHADEGRSIT